MNVLPPARNSNSGCVLSPPSPISPHTRASESFWLRSRCFWGNPYVWVSCGTTRRNAVAGRSYRFQTRSVGRSGDAPNQRRELRVFREPPAAAALCERGFSLLSHRAERTQCEGQGTAHLQRQRRQPPGRRSELE